MSGSNSGQTPMGYGGSTQYGQNGGQGSMMGGFGQQSMNSYRPMGPQGYQGYGGSRPMSRMSTGYQQSAPSGFAGAPTQANMDADAQMRARYMSGGQPAMAYSSPVQQPTAPTNGGFTPPYQMPIFTGQQNTSEGWWRNAGQPRGGIPPVGGQFNPMVGSQTNPTMPSQGPVMSSDNMEQFNPSTQPMGNQAQSQAPQTQAPQQSRAPQQTFEQFAATMGENGMTSGQLNDAYQKSIQPQATNFWGNVGPGGTQNPFPGKTQPFPSQWGNQTFGFDPRALAGQQVTGDKGWYYGRDAIGRTIGNDGSAMAGFGGAADGFNRSRPWG